MRKLLKQKFFLLVGFVSFKGSRLSRKTEKLRIKYTQYTE